MNVNLNIGPKNSFINAARINHGISRGGAAALHGASSGRKDSVEISPKGRANNLIQSLMDQKKIINENKSELISNTLQNGGTIKDLQIQLETYDEQLQNIDDQISQTLAQQAEQQLQKEEKAKNSDDEEPKTEKEIESDRLNSVVDLAASIDISKTVSSLKAANQSNIRILKSQIKLDKTYPHADKIAVRNLISKKAELVSEMENESGNLVSKIGETAAKVTELVKENSDTKPSEKEAAAEKKEDKNISGQELEAHKINQLI